jgi:isoaspartyl peptidase/L-asparaginase-like protein (Ntn-hydrolase superfamily)
MRFTTMEMPVLDELDARGLRSAMVDAVQSLRAALEATEEAIRLVQHTPMQEAPRAPVARLGTIEIDAAVVDV